ncbi:MAG: hypothetical protein IT582_04795 [Opitutaceae bacterium]|nr:hypothetical protein [Opitutaceae bacterium]
MLAFTHRGHCRASLLVGALFLVASAGASRGMTPGAAWAEILDSKPKRVLKAADGADAPRESRLAEGAAWMSLQPSTDENLAQAGRIFAELAKGDDEIAAQAGYLQARLWQLHHLQPDYERAAQLYEALAEKQPASHWAQLGLVKLGMLKLYALPGVEDRIAAAEAVLARLAEPERQRDLHLQIGQAGVILKAPLERILPHLVAADKIGGVSGTAKEDLVVQIGELAMRAGQPDLAGEYFERYLRDYPDNLRAYEVRERLTEVKKQRAHPEGAR